MLKKYLYIFLISMVPLIELRGAIPVSQGFQLPLLQSYIVCVIGNMLPVPVIYLFARKVLEWGKDKKYYFLLEFRFREQVHGREHLQQVFLIWDLRRV